MLGYANSKSWIHAWIVAEMSVWASTGTASFPVLTPLVPARVERAVLELRWCGVGPVLCAQIAKASFIIVLTDNTDYAH